MIEMNETKYDITRVSAGWDDVTIAERESHWFSQSAGAVSIAGFDDQFVRSVLFQSGDG